MSGRHSVVGGTSFVHRFHHRRREATRILLFLLYG